MSWKALGLYAFLAMLSCGCASTTTKAQVKSAGAAVSEGWRLTFRLSGGFAGFDRQLEVADTGSVSAADRLRGNPITTKTTDDELKEIADALRGVESMTATRSEDCRDCFEYSIEVQTNGKTFSLRFNDGAPQDRRVAALVDVLTRVLNRVLSGQQSETK